MGDFLGEVHLSARSESNPTWEPNLCSRFSGTSGDILKAATLIVVAIIIGPAIAAFATKKYF